jgi:hypothetical protein
MKKEQAILFTAVLSGTSLPLATACFIFKTTRGEATVGSGLQWWRKFQEF